MEPMGSPKQSLFWGAKPTSDKALKVGSYYDLIGEELVKAERFRRPL